MQLRCSASPLLDSSQASHGRTSRNRLRRGSTSQTEEAEEGTNNGNDSSMSTPPSPPTTAAPGRADAYIKDDTLPVPTPMNTQDVPSTMVVHSVSYVPAVQLMATVFQDGRVAILSLPVGGLSDIEHARCLRWIYKPKSHAVRAVTAAIQPSGHYIAVGLAHGRVAIYSMTRILTPVNALGGKYHPNSRHTSVNTTFHQNHRSSMDSSRTTFVPESSGNDDGGIGGACSNAGQPEPDHILSLTEWGYSSSLLGPAHVLRWSPDGKVVAAGYAYRGLAVWTPSGCRVMCTLRQAAQGMAISSAAEVTSGAERLLPGTTNALEQEREEGEEEKGSRLLENNETGDFENGTHSPSGLNPHHAPAATTSTSASDGAAGNSTGATTGILEGGVAVLAWSQHGYSLVLIEGPPPPPPPPPQPLIGSSSPVTGMTDQLQQHQELLEISFAKAVHSGHRVAESRPMGPAGGAANEQQRQQGVSTSTSSGNQQQQSASPEDVFVLQGADRLLLVLETMPSSGAAVHAGLLDVSQAEAVLHWQSDLTLQHVRLPQEYLNSAFPILHVAVSPESRDIAVAGTRGLAVLNYKTRKWRLFGDAMQERRVKAHALTWLPRGIVAAIASVDETTSTSSIKGGKLASSPSSGVSLANSSGGGGGALSSSSSATPTLLLFPRDHLDFSSLVAQYRLPRLPAAVDAVGSFLALAYAPLEICLLRVDYLDHHQQQSIGTKVLKAGATKLTTTLAKATITPIRELNILGLGGPLQELTLLPPSLLPTESKENEQGQEDMEENSSGIGAKVGGWLKKSVSSNTISQIKYEEGPSHCVLLRGGGILSVLDLQNGTESVLADQIESYWVPQSSGSKPILPAPALTTMATPAAASSTLLSAVGHRDDSAAAMPIDELNSPAAKGAAWLERRTSDVAAAAAAMGSDELAAIAAAHASMGISNNGGLRESSYGSSSFLLGSGGVVDEEAQPVEMPWWTYGARGMQLWFPSSLFDPSWGRSNFSGTVAAGSGSSHQSLINNDNKQNFVGSGPYSAAASFAASARGGANATDPELEFDKEVYPLGISLAEVSIVGIMQRTARSSRFPAKSPPAFSLHPHSESQPVLPCLLRRLLEQGRAADALELATRHSRGPHFARSLEWLLFTTLEADADAPKDARRVRFASPKAVPAEERTLVFEPAAAAPGAASASRMGVLEKRKKAALRGVAGPLLISAARLVQQFPQSAEIVVSVARKTDAQLWPALFAAAGSPSALCEGLLSNGALQTAACCLLIVDRVEGAGKAHGLALRLVRSALAASSYGLAADLLRFLMPPGENELAELVSPGQSGLDDYNSAASKQQQQHKEENVPQQQEQNTRGGTVAWLWSYFAGADKLPACTATESVPAPSTQEESVTKRLHRAASAGSLADDRDTDGNVAELGAAVGAWRVMGRHAWKLLDSGALRELASFGAAMSNLHGGLPALLSTAAGEVPLSLAHTTPSAAAIASALFVASNEFATATESDVDAAAAAESLEMTCAAAGCVNHAMALALMLGDTAAVEAFAAEHQRVWALLTELIANDVHLCAFSGLLSAPTTPLMGGFNAGGFNNF